MGSGSPYNNRIEQTARGCHAFRVRESRASNPPGLSLPGQALRPGSLLIRALYGHCWGPSKRHLGASAWKDRGPWSGYGIHGVTYTGPGRNEFLRGCFGACTLKRHGPFGAPLSKQISSSCGTFGRPGKGKARLSLPGEEADVRAAREEARLDLEKRGMKWASRGMDAC